MARRKAKSRMGTVITFAFLFSISVGALAGALAGFLGSAPTLAEVEFNPQLTTYVYDVEGRVLARLYKENRDSVPLSAIPVHLRHAVLAVEDERFYTHHGIDFRGLLRALVVNVRAGEIRQGGSTLTQQLAKNAFLSHERTITRKLRELLWTIQIERRYSKDEILEAYLNQICFGHGAYGAEAGAQLYFGKHVKDVTLPEAAFLAGVTNGPSVFSPFINKEAATRRRDFVLRRMEQLGYISESQSEAARRAPLVTIPLRRNERKAPYFVDYILQTLLELYGEQLVYGGGLRVYTTLSSSVQAAAEQALLQGLPSLKVDANGLQQPQGAVVAIDPLTGAIRAMVGGRGTDKFNRAVQAQRQPGSAIKPIVYAAALESGLTPATVMRDEPLSLQGSDGGSWQPENYDRRYRGDISLRYALEESVNIIAVKLLQQLGPRTVLDYGRRLGITTLVEKGAKNDLNASLALGGLTRGVSPLELTAAYVPFANGGIYIPPWAISRIEDNNGNVLRESRTDRRTVVSEALAYLMTDMMRGVIDRGTGKRAAISRPAAGKTGTTSDYTNAWFVGYTPELVATVWIGNDAQKDAMVSREGSVGSAKAAEIWAAFMKKALAAAPAQDFRKPSSGLAEAVAIDTGNGLLAPEGCRLPADSVRRELFLEDHVPKAVSPRCD